ncbi:MAG: hypothetical protein V3V99_14795 [candidate division Zixibacteria bacterium]
MKTVYFIIGCDTDPDRTSFISGVTDKQLSWIGMDEGIHAVKEATKDILDSEGKSPIFSWCLRVDDQIRHYDDDYAWVLKSHRKLFEDLEKSGDELSWHPHFWRYNNQKSFWYQETQDIEWQTEMLQMSHSAYQDVFPDRPLSVRMGWNFHNTNSMKTLSNLGIKVDFSGVPGMRVDPSPLKVDNIYNWFDAPPNPYYPSNKDFQTAGIDNNKMGILEVPNLVAKSIAWGYIAGIVLAKKMKNIKPLFVALRRPRYWINISAERHYFKPLLNEFHKHLRRKKTTLLIFNNYFHADDMVENNSAIYSLRGFKNNLNDLVNAAKESGAHIKFIKACDSANIFNQKADN